MMDENGKDGSTARGALHHAHYFCNNLESMINFWQRGFGAVLVERRKFGACEGAVLDLGGGVPMYLKELPCATPGYQEQSGLDHIGVRVENLEASLERVLVLPGVSLKTSPFVSGSLLCAFVLTGDDVLVELVQNI